MRLARRGFLTLGVACGLAGCTRSENDSLAPSVSNQPDSPGSQPPSPINISPGNNPFDALYDANFRLNELAADPIQELARPEPATSLTDAVIDPAYGTRLYRLTHAGEQTGGRLRHEYSRRQAFNADNTRFLAQGENGTWWLHDANNFQRIEQLTRLEGDCEPLWDPADPARFIHTSRNGGLQWWDQNGQVILDLTGRTPWPEATSYWTRGEGTTSANGSILTLLASRYDEGSQTSTCYGIITVDLREDRILGVLDAKDFPVPEAFPDHVSTSGSGNYAVVSWLAGQGGTVAWPVDFSSQRLLIDASQHSDLALGADGEDLLVAADYATGQIVAINLETGQRNELHTLYPAEGEGYACHISGQAFDKPGWAVISTYADFAEYGAVDPARELRGEYRKVWLLELASGGRALNVAHIRADWDEAAGDSYFLEPQASVSRDLSRIVFASNFGGGEVNSYLVGLPGWVLEG